MSISRKWSFFDEFVDHISSLSGCEITEFEADGVVRVWIEFSYRENRFFVDNNLGDFRLFVEDPECDENILFEIADHLRLLLEKPGGNVEEIQSH